MAKIHDYAVQFAAFCRNEGFGSEIGDMMQLIKLCERYARLGAEATGDNPQRRKKLLAMNRVGDKLTRLAYEKLQMTPDFGVGLYPVFVRQYGKRRGLRVHLPFAS